MKFSSATAFADLTPYQGHLWSIRFINDADMNVFDAGGSIGKEFPALSVQEDLFTINFDQIQIANGLTIPVPQYVTYLGNININFWDKMTDSDVLLLEKTFVDWAGYIHNSNAFKNLDDPKVTRTIEILKYNPKTNSPVAVSRYRVLPPDVLVFNPTGAADVYTNTVRLTIVGTEKIHDK